MGDFDGLIWIALIWFAVSFLSAQQKRKQRADRARRQAQARPKPVPPAPKPVGQRSRQPTGTVVPRLDATQREGSALERMLRQLGADLEGLEQRQRGPLGRRGDTALPPAEDVEDREILDRPVRVVERAPVVRPEREVVDRDDEAEETVRRRLAAAEEHNRPITLADHRAFDRRVRESSAESGPRPRPRRSSMDLRRAVVWREILGPPIALRDRSDG